MIVKGCVIFERTLLSRKKSHNLALSCASSNLFYCASVKKDLAAFTKKNSKVLTAGFFVSQLYDNSLIYYLKYSNCLFMEQSSKLMTLTNRASVLN